MFSVGENIKLMDSVFSSASNDSDPLSQYGKLNYFLFFKDLEFEVVGSAQDSQYGDIVEVKCTNDPDFIDPIFFIAQDCEIVSSTLKVDYIIESTTLDDLKAVESSLLSTRKQLKKKNLSASTQVMRSNWKEILDIRKKISSFVPDKKIVVPRYGMVLPDPNISDPDKLTRHIVGKIRQVRRDMRASNPKLTTRAVPSVQDLKFTTTNGIHTESGTFAKAQEGIDLRRIDASKVPVKKDKHVGVEIEMITSQDIKEIKKSLIRNRLHYYVHVGTDGSIRPELDNERGYEIRVLATEKDMPNVITKLCTVLAEHDCYVNKSCGLHVHLDMRNRNVKDSYKNLFMAKDIIRGLQPKHRLENARYCADNDESNFERQAGSGRYFAINASSYSARQTLEIRVCEGTIDSNLINNWIKVLVGLVDANISNKVAKIKDLSSVEGITPDLVQFMNDRAKSCGDVLNIA